MRVIILIYLQVLYHFVDTTERTLANFAPRFYSPLFCTLWFFLYNLHFFFLFFFLKRSPIEADVVVDIRLCLSKYFCDKHFYVTDLFLYT